MRIAIVSGIRNGAIDQVMQALEKGLKGKGVDCDRFDTYVYSQDHANDLGFEDYDLVHFGYYNYGFAYRGHIAQPQVGNIWHIPPDKVEKYGGHILETGFERVICDDVGTLQMLGQVGIMNTTQIPLFFDYDKFSPLPVPKGEFTVGVFCNDYGYKRWEVVAAACQELDILCHPVVTSKDRKAYQIDPIKDVYSHCHVYVHATFMDTNSLPAREAILCGRPVITVPNYGLNQLIIDGQNGLFFDGTTGDLKRAILQAKADYDALRFGAMATILPSRDKIIKQYIGVFEKVLNEIEID